MPGKNAAAAAVAAAAVSPRRLAARRGGIPRGAMHTRAPPQSRAAAARTLARGRRLAV